MIKYLIFFILTIGSIYAQKSSSDTLTIYFDTPSLDLLKNDATLKYQAKKYLSKKKKKVKYAEIIIYNSKTQKKIIFEVKHYNKVKFIEEKHPLLSLIKRKDRKTFIDILKKDGIKYPLKLKYILQSQTLNTQTYKELFDLKMKSDSLFSLKLQYPYLLNLFFALFISSFGLLIIYFLIKSKK